MQNVQRTDFRVQSGTDRRVASRSTGRAGIIIQNGTGGADLLVGFGGNEVGPDSHSIRLAPGERFQEFSPDLVPSNEIRAAFDGASGRGFVTEFYGDR